AGGEILKDATGQPTGIFRETAQGLVGRAHAERLRQRLPEERARDLHTAIRLAQEECLAKGVTSFQDAGSSFATIDVLKALAEQGKLQLRLWVMVRAGNEEMGTRLGQYRMV